MSKATYDDANLILRLYEIRREEKLKPVMQRIERFGRLPHPAAHGLVGDLHAEPLENLRLTMHRHMIGYFADDHLRQ